MAYAVNFITLKIFNCPTLKSTLRMLKCTQHFMVEFWKFFIENFYFRKTVFCLSIFKIADM